MADARRWFRVKASYHKPTGGFLAIGPPYPGELVDAGTAVRFRHHGAPEWVEVVPIEHVDEVEGSTSASAVEVVGRGGRAGARATP